ncbi:MAG: flagellar protein FlgN [Lachnospiraceae bacterium]|nr:flagellar protein FlgN [Lachnospiraceae bacterium]
MEDLIATLHQETELYETLLGLSSRKTSVIVSGDLSELSQITDEEQGIVAKIATLDKKRQSAMKDIANVLNMDVNSLRLTDLVQMLDKRPEEQRQLAEERDRLKVVADNVKRVNGQNQELLQSSLEMVQFEMNILQTSGRAPETANYTRAAGTSGDVIGLDQGKFDAKQ